MRLFFILLGFGLLTACSPSKPATIEEDLLVKSFAKYVEGLTYDEVCNGTSPKSRYDLNKPENVNLIGHQQMFAARIGGLRHIRYPEKPIKEGVKLLLGVQDKVDKNARKILKAEGCSSDKGKALAKAYDIYRKSHPAIVSGMIDKEIINRGGRITSPEEVEAAGKPANPSVNTK